METVGPPPPDAELHLLTEWGDPSDRPRQRRAGVISVLLHGAVILALLLAPATVFEGPRNAFSEGITPLIAPYSKLTKAGTPRPLLRNIPGRIFGNPRPDAGSARKNISARAPSRAVYSLSRSRPRSDQGR